MATIHAKMGYFGHCCKKVYRSSGIQLSRGWGQGVSAFKWRHFSKEKSPSWVVHRQIKDLNDVVEADHGKLKQLIDPIRGFKTLKTVYATIRGFEVMRAFR